MKLLASLLSTAVGLWAATRVVSGFEFSGSIWEFLGLTLLLWAVGAIAKPILKLFSLPFIVLTLGLFLLVINAVVLQLVVWLGEPERLDLGISSTGFFWATFLAALVISIVRLLVELVLPDGEKV